MKIYCDKCHEPINIPIDSQFDKFLVGQPICPSCHKQQKRYISESDLLLYMTINECFYLLLTVITSILFNFFKLSYITIIAIIVMLAFGFIGLKNVDRLIYTKANYNKDINNLNEDKQKIQKSMNWQSMLFFVLVISYVTLNEVNYFFLAISVLSIIFTYIKFRLSIKKGF